MLGGRLRSAQRKMAIVRQATALAERPMIVPTTVPLQHRALVERANEYVKAGVFQKAAVRFEQCRDALEGMPGTDRCRLELQAASESCWGLEALIEVDLPARAIESFGRAQEAYAELEDQDGVLLAAAFSRVASGRMELGSDAPDTDAVIEHFSHARRLFNTLENQSDDDDGPWMVQSQMLAVEIALIIAIGRARDDDYDGARAMLASGRDGVDVLRGVAGQASQAEFMGSYVDLCEAMLPLMDAFARLDDFEVDDAQEVLGAARDAMPVALSTDEGPQPSRLVALGRLPNALRMLCDAGSEECTGWRRLSESRKEAALGSFQRARDGYDDSVLALARAGSFGSTLLYVAANRRDRMESILRLMSTSHPLSQLEKPDFIALVRKRKIAEQLERDYRETMAAYEIGAWKLAVIGAGSILEAVLLDALTRRWKSVVRANGYPEGSKATQVVKDWSLSDMIDAAKAAGFITKGHTSFSHGIREYRNLVHPGVEMRSRQGVDDFAALAALAALHAVMRDLLSRR